MNENIFLTLDENENNHEEIQEEDFSKLLVTDEQIISDDHSSSFNGTTLNNDFFIMYCHYELNFNVKQLLVIGEYYGLKQLKKANKLTIIHSIVEFENNVENKEIVHKRKHLWFYIEELKKDKFMKKYILC